MMPFIDLKKQYSYIKEKVLKRIENVLEHGQYIMGPEVEEFEQELTKFVGVKHAISMSNGTDALLVPMMAKNIGPGDEVITTAFSFFASAEMISLAGATPVFVDINPDTYNMDPNKLEAAITKKTKAIIPVGLYGQTSDMNPINEIALKNNIFVLEDGAQSFGSTYHGKFSGNLSQCGSTSFFPAKPLGCYGDGGALFTNDDQLAKVMREIRNQGQEKRYYHTRIGMNGRLDTLQCAILLEKIAIFPEEIKQRQQVAAMYNKKLQGKVKTMKVPTGHTCVYAQYTLEVENRDNFQKALTEEGIPTSVHYPLTLNKQPIYVQLGFGNKSYPIAEKAAAKVVSLPMHPYLTEKDVDHICSVVLKFV